MRSKVITASTYVRLVSLILAATLLVPHNTYGQDSKQLCYKGEYILPGNTSKVKSEKVVFETIQNQSKTEVNIEEKTPQNLMLLDNMGSSLNSRRESIIECRQNKLCRTLDKAAVLELRQERITNTRRSKTHQLREAARNCEPNRVLFQEKTSNDTYKSLLWGLHQASDIDIDAPEAWDLSTGSQNVVVAVIDTGVDYNHPDLAENIWTNPNEIAGNGIDDDANGYVDDIHGFNSIDNSGNPMDDNGHGTHCSGTIGAKGNNGTGVVGVNWDIKIIGAKFLGSSGSGSLYNAIKSIDYITNLKQNYGVDVVATNNSWGCAGCYSSSLAAAIERANQQNILFIAAAGNSNSDNDTTPHYPSSYTNSNIISVAAIGTDGSRASFSNWGLNSVDLGAPGVSIASTYPGNQYYYMSGTSMATPHVTGAVALAKAFVPGASAEVLKNALLSSVVPYSSMNNITTTGGVLNLYNYLVATASAPAPTPTPTQTPTPSPTATPTTSPTPTPTLTPTPTMTPTPSPTPTPTIVANITGNVRLGSSNGSGVEGVKVTLSVGSENIVTYTDSNGGFYFNNITGPAPAAIQMSKSGFGFVPSKLNFTFNGNFNYNFIAYSKLYVLKAKVVGLDGSPKSDVSISAGELGSTTTNAQGFAYFSVPANANYILDASANSSREFKQSILLGNKIPGDTTRVFVQVSN